MFNIFSRINRRWKAYRRGRHERRQLRADLSFIQKLPVASPQAGKVLLIRLDDIGDYILFRNTLAALKESTWAEGREITLLGNAAWKQLFEAWDAETADQVIWLEKGKWHKEAYRHQLYGRLRAIGFETVLMPSYSRRPLLDDLLALAAGANRVLCRAPIEAELPSYQFDAASAMPFTEVESRDQDMFEFDLNRHFFEDALGVKLALRRPALPLPSNRRDRIGIFPNAAHKSKRWPEKKFGMLLRRLLPDFPGWDAVILGAPFERQRADRVAHFAGHGPIRNLAGETNLLQLAEEISHCSLFITCDTSAFHLAAAAGVKTIVISNGVNHRRFIEYPDAMGLSVMPVYPKKFILEAGTGKFSAQMKLKALSSEIRSISVSEVSDAVRNLLNG